MYFCFFGKKIFRLDFQKVKRDWCWRSLESCCSWNWRLFRYRYLFLFRCHYRYRYQYRFRFPITGHHRRCRQSKRHRNRFLVPDFNQTKNLVTSEFWIGKTENRKVRLHSTYVPAMGEFFRECRTWDSMFLSSRSLKILGRSSKVEFTRLDNKQMDSTRFSPNFRILLEILKPKTRVQMYSNVEYLTR